MSPAADLFRAVPSSGKSVAFVLSACMHAAVALAAARGAPHAAVDTNAAPDPLLDIAELDLTPTVTPEPTSPTPESAAVAAPARHHHDYAVAPDHDATAHDPSLRHVLPLTSAASTPSASAPAVVEAPAAIVPRFSMTVGASTRAPIGANLASGTNEVASAGEPAPPVAEASVEVPAQLLAGGTPTYTHEAEAAGVEADVPLEIVVDAKGAVVSARALAHVGYGLDEAALRSIRGYRFSPARRHGKALPVRMRWLMRFQLR